jgi:membrane-bound serine protease (ClpP class)
MSHLLGATGEAKTPLRPSGTAIFSGEPVQVVTRGTMVAPGRRVKVVDVTGNRVVVEELDGAP